MTLFDSGQKDWEQNASTIIHEATHQTAFNTGVHSRFGTPPRWVAEGLGTLYEARGFWNSRSYTQQSDRLNTGRLAQFREFIAAGRPAGAFVDMISSDRIFQRNPAAAYAEAWALSFYLARPSCANTANIWPKRPARTVRELSGSAATLGLYRHLWGQSAPARRQLVAVYCDAQVGPYDCPRPIGRLIALGTHVLDRFTYFFIATPRTDESSAD